MKVEQIAAMQSKVGAKPDGWWGPKSIAAAQRWARDLCPRNPWPATSQAALTAFYGAPGDESQMTLLTVPTGVKLKYLGKEIGRPGPADDRVYCHWKVADSLERILVALAKVNPGILLKFAGCYNNRPMRNGRLPSLHARGAAIDLDPGPNGNLVSWPSKATMPIEVIEVFGREGWTSAAIWWHRDSMHFQATQP